MTLFIILIIILSFGIYLTTNYDHEPKGVVIIFISGCYLLIHSFFYFTSSYSYDLFVEKRNSFEQTLNESRKKSNQFESDGILKEITEWNKNLAVYKYDNKTLFFGQYIDDRIEFLQPIK